MSKQRNILKYLPKGPYRTLGEIVLAAEWGIELTADHIAFVPPKGWIVDGEQARTVHCPKTPSDYNSFYRVRGKLRRAGLVI